MIRLWPDTEVTTDLAIAEGIETALAAAGAGITPIWSTISAGSMAMFPVVAGLERLTVVADHDRQDRRGRRAGIEAAAAVIERYAQAGFDPERDLRVLLPPIEGEGARRSVWRKGCGMNGFAQVDMSGAEFVRRHGHGTPPSGEESERSERRPPEPMGSAAYTGLAGELVALLDPHTEAAPEAVLMQFLSAFGNAIGRGPFYRVEADHHGPNVFVVLVGDTSKARKGTSWRRIRSCWSSPIRCGRRTPSHPVCRAEKA